MLPYASSRLQHCFQTGGIGGVRGGEAVELENFWQLNVQLKKKKKVQANVKSLFMHLIHFLLCQFTGF